MFRYFIGKKKTLIWRWGYRISHGITNVSKIHPLGNMKVSDSGGPECSICTVPELTWGRQLIWRVDVVVFTWSWDVCVLACPKCSGQTRIEGERVYMDPFLLDDDRFHDGFPFHEERSIGQFSSCVSASTIWQMASRICSCICFTVSVTITGMLTDFVINVTVACSLKACACVFISSCIRLPLIDHKHNGPT